MAQTQWTQCLNDCLFNRVLLVRYTNGNKIVGNGLYLKTNTDSELVGDRLSCKGHEFDFHTENIMIKWSGYNVFDIVIFVIVSTQ